MNFEKQGERSRTTRTKLPRSVFVAGIRLIPGHTFEEFRGDFVHIEKTRLRRIVSFSNEIDSIRSIIGEIYIRKYVADHFGLKPRQISISTNAFGKPFIADLPDFHYNIAHSGDWIVVATGNMPLGVDVERIHSFEPFSLDCVFTPEERDYITEGGDQSRVKRFFEMWTLKESFVKCLGVGFSRPFSTFSVERDPQWTTVKQFGIRTPHTLWTEKFDSNHCCSLCIESGPLEPVWAYHTSDRYVGGVC